MSVHQKKSAKRAKGPAGLPFIGSLFRARRDPLKFVMDVTREYGDVAHFRIGIYTGYLLNHPDYYRHVLQEHYQNYSKKNYNYKMIKTLLGEGLITADHERWTHHRKLIQPLFHSERIADLGAVMTEATRAMLKKWEGNISRAQPVPMASEMTKLSLKIIMRSLFSSGQLSSAESFRKAFNTINEDISDRFKTVFVPPLWLPTQRNRRFKKALADLNRQVYEIIGQRRESNATHNDLLDMLLATRETGDKIGLTEREIRDEVMTFLLAGHDTTANLLSWTSYLLARHPEVMNKVRKELDEVLQDSDPEPENIRSLSYLKMVLQESLRLFPPVWIISRKAVKRDVIGGYEIPPEATVTLCSYAIHRHPGFWEDPEEFKPERFSGEQAHPAYFPFGYGPRSCIGAHFAMIEAQWVLSMILRRYRLNPVHGNPVAPEPMVTLKPNTDLKMYLIRSG